jgi:heterotetrameric sarcosine oxidase delta subunit
VVSAARHGSREVVVILLECPHCGPRDASEFRHAGERRTRPDPNATTPHQWREYLYLRDNPAGWVTETWAHRAGCRRYLAVERHTVTNEVRAVRDLQAPP